VKLDRWLWCWYFLAILIAVEFGLNNQGYAAAFTASVGYLPLVARLLYLRRRNQ
jgi:hypothetical protein